MGTAPGGSGGLIIGGGPKGGLGIRGTMIPGGAAWLGSPGGGGGGGGKREIPGDNTSGCKVGIRPGLGTGGCCRGGGGGGGTTGISLVPEGLLMSDSGSVPSV